MATPGDTSTPRPTEALLRWPTAVAIALGAGGFFLLRTMGASIAGALVGATTIGLLISIRVDLSEIRGRLARLEEHEAP